MIDVSKTYFYLKYNHIYFFDLFYAFISRRMFLYYYSENLNKQSNLLTVYSK